MSRRKSFKKSLRESFRRLRSRRSDRRRKTEGPGDDPRLRLVQWRTVSEWIFSVCHERTAKLKLKCWPGKQSYYNSYLMYPSANEVLVQQFSWIRWKNRWPICSRKTALTQFRYLVGSELELEADSRRLWKYTPEFRWFLLKKNFMEYWQHNVNWRHNVVGV